MFESLIVVVAELGLASLFFMLAYRMTGLAKRETFALPAWAASSGAFSESPAAFRESDRQVSLSPGRDDRESGACDLPGGYPRYSFPQAKASGRIRVNGLSDRAELITQLHILFGLQDRVCRQHHFVLKESPRAIQHYTAAWLYGAANALAAPNERHSSELVQVVCQLLERKIGIDMGDASQVLSGLTRCSIGLACYRCGVEGAEHWQEHHFIPNDCALNTALTSNAFI
ncbi:hypothetical protein [Marinobacter mobilis]|uniref:Uncharacterized protein n=1 Tax=Marinobacter mobilis TaxID=488533 RepID=A0A1H2VDC6_9GAMM|nr:hypothetical protein [Marinobacter mobilis]SDW66210.1 hypothetical protein SAMN04487960_103411 [Marinobacter mobilis]